MKRHPEIFVRPRLPGFLSWPVLACVAFWLVVLLEAL